MNVTVWIFQTFYCWVYTRKLRRHEGGVKCLGYKDIFEVFDFADGYKIPMLKNDLVDLLCEYSCKNWSHPLRDLHFVYERTRQGSLLRKYIVDNAVEFCDWDHILNDIHQYPKLFLAEVILVASEKGITLGSQQISRNEWYRNRRDHICDYHDHGVQDEASSASEVSSSTETSMSNLDMREEFD